MLKLYFKLLLNEKSTAIFNPWYNSSGKTRSLEELFSIEFNSDIVSLIVFTFIKS